MVMQVRNDYLEMTNLINRQEQRIEELQSVMRWQTIETVEKGDGVDCPPVLLLFENGKVSVAYWDAYYDQGGRGYKGTLAWVEPISGELLVMYYDPPIAWMPLPKDMKAQGGNDGK